MIASSSMVVGRERREASLMFVLVVMYLFFFFNDPATTEIYTLSLHDALPIFDEVHGPGTHGTHGRTRATLPERSEEHTSELQSQSNLVCRLLLEKKKTYHRNR